MENEAEFPLMFPSHMLSSILIEHNEFAEQPKSIAPAIAKLPTCLFLLSAILPCFSPFSFLTQMSKCSFFISFYIICICVNNSFISMLFNDDFIDSFM